VLLWFLEYSIRETEAGYDSSTTGEPEQTGSDRRKSKKAEIVEMREQENEGTSKRENERS